MFQRSKCVAGAMVGMTVLFAVAVTASWTHADPEIDKQLWRLPAGTNAIVIADIRSFLDSKMAKDQGWGEYGSSKAPKSMPPLPSRPSIDRIILGAQLAMPSMEQNWEAAIIDVNRDVPMRTIAKGTGGYLDSIADREAAYTNAGTVFIKLDDELIGAVHPGNRQFATQWIQQQLQKPSSSTGSLTPYLARAASQVTEKLPVVMAIDLRDATSTSAIRKILMHDPPAALAGMDLSNPNTVTELAQLVSSIQGLTMRITMTDKASGVATINFGKDVKPIEGVAKELVLEVLAEKGMSIPDLASWEFEAKGTTITAKGDFTIHGLRQILSVLTAPEPEDEEQQQQQQQQQTVQSNQPGTPATASQAAQASLKYYKTIEGIIDTLKPGPSLGDGASWLNRYAKRIDSMPILNVDPDLIAWGTDVAATFRGAAVTMANGQNNVRAAVSTISAPTHYLDYSNDGYHNDEGNEVSDAVTRAATAEYQRQRRQVSLQAKNASTEQALAPIKAVMDSKAKIRIEMTQKYGVEF